MTAPNLFEQMFKTVLSMHFGRTFWLDENDDFCSAPTHKDGTTDYDMWDYVSEWDMEGVDFDKLFYVHKELVTNAVTEYEQMRA